MSYSPIRTERSVSDRFTTELPPTSSRLNSNSKRPSRKTGTRNRSSRNPIATDYPIIVHCHLCWDWVWQRPQQFMSRLSQRHKILFVETVGPDASLAAPLARIRAAEGFPNITILRIQFPEWQWHKPRYVDAQRRQIVKQFLSSPAGRAFRNPVQWFYDPMAFAAFGGKMGEVLTVYDCMDELSKFRFAPPEIIEREARLLAAADVVFAGGARLHDSKSRHNSNCHFYGCGVDCSHFGSAREETTKVPPELAALPKPVLGYFGVVDERIDYELLAALADANPEWSLAIVGPVLKVEESMLPRRKNLHWLGQRPYQDLPALCKGFDVCLMPFALNESTEFINPTKTLEYMATGRPIISSAVPDVVRNFSQVVKIARSHEEFIEHCRQALQGSVEQVERGLAMAAENTWDSIVTKLEGHMEEAIRNKQPTPNGRTPRKKRTGWQRLKQVVSNGAQVKTRRVFSSKTARPLRTISEPALA